MPSLANLVRVVSLTTGTGTITLGGAVTGFLTPSQAGMVNGQSYSYAIEASYVVLGDDMVPTAREVGNGVYDSGAGTLTRNVINSTNGNSLLNLTGDQQVIICVTTESFSPVMAQNLVINGGMMVSQQRVAASFTLATGNYIVDMVQGFEIGAQVLTAQQRTEHPPGFFNSARMLVATANASPASGDFTSFTLNVEGYRIAPLGWGAAGASSIAIGFWVIANRTGNYSVSINNGAFNRSYCALFTVIAANTWEYKTVVIPGDTSGTWDTANGVGLSFNVVMMAGTGLSIAANTWSATASLGVTGAINGVAATSDVMAITGVSIVAGTVPVPRELSASFMRAFDDELALCQRYYEKSFDYTTAPANNVGLTLGAYSYIAAQPGALAESNASIGFKARKRIAPTVTFYNPSANNSNVRDVTGSVDCSGTTYGSYENSFFMSCIGNAATVYPNQLSFYWTADSRM